MNNKLTDVDILFIFIWLAIGTGLGVFIAPLFKANTLFAGGLGLLFGTIVAYVQFFKPLWVDQRRSRRMNQHNPNNVRQNEDEDDLEQAKINALKFIRNAIDAENVHLRNDFKPASSLGSAVIQGQEEDDLEDDDIDAEDNDEKDTDLEEESDEAENEDIETDDQFAVPDFYRNESGAYSSLNRENPENQSQPASSSWLTSNITILRLSFLWLAVSSIILGQFSELTKYLSPSLFAFLPILFVIGLSGQIGIRLKQEDSTLENRLPIFDLLKMILGWGLGIYLVVKYIVK